MLPSRSCRTVWFVGLALALLAAAPSMHAQSRPEDRAWYQRLTDSVAGLVYWAAWPTATYQNLAIQDINVVAEGAVVTLRLHGKSAFADGDLWVDVQMGLRRSGEVTSLQWGSYNGFFPPGFTWKTLGEAAQEVNRRNAPALARNTAGSPPSAEAAPRPATTIPLAELTAVCLSNPTMYALNYSMTWGSKTEQLSLAPGATWRFWAPADAGAFQIKFDGDLTNANAQVSYNLRGVTRRGEPAACSDDMTIDFVASETRLAVQPRVWSPGSAHPFWPNVVASATKGSWLCAKGFKWARPNDENSLDCLDARFGYVGVSIVIDANQVFPRIAQVTPGSSAEQAGLVSGMYLVSVDGMSTEGLATDAIVARVRGDAGTTVRLGISVVNGPPRVYTLTRR